MYIQYIYIAIVVEKSFQHDFVIMLCLESYKPCKSSKMCFLATRKVGECSIYVGELNNER